MNYSADKNSIWQAALAKIEYSLSRPSFLTWFQETGVKDIQNGIMTLFVPNIFVKEWLQNKYHKNILHVVREMDTDIKDINYVIGKPDADAASTIHKQLTKKRLRSESFSPDGEELITKDALTDPETSLNPRYTFDRFVVGSCNELAHAAAQSVVKNPGTTYNPLFIYGGVGLGKTHLIQAIGNTLIKEKPHYRVRYVPAEKFMGEIVEALRNQTMNDLRGKYRAVDLLIMDDIQFIARTEKMQEEFFHTFNTLYEKNKQIIISSDKPPQAIATLENRLRSRFEGGMIADVGIPDFETRLIILKAKKEQKSYPVSEDILSYIAQNIKTNIRELEGALNKIIVASQLSAAPFDIEQAKKILAAYLNAPKKIISAKKIIKTVCDFYDITERELMNNSRKKDIVRPRQITMYLLRSELKNSFPSIGEKLGGRDHTTVIHSCEKIGQELETNIELKEEIQILKERLFV
jgi:chromosomal replication initiator protein